MSAFGDALMRKLHAPGGVEDLLFPAGAVRLARVRQLLGLLHSLPAAIVHDVVKLEATGLVFQRPLFRARRMIGTRVRTQPDHAHTDVRLDERDGGGPPEWIDLSVRLHVTVVLELDSAAVESIALGDVGEYDTLEEFRGKFRYLDLDGYLARHHVTTVDELKRSYRHLLGDIRLAAPPAFDPADPANQVSRTLDLAVLARDDADLTGALRQARLVADLAERAIAYPHETNAALAPVLVFPDTVGIPDEELAAFFSDQDVLAVKAAP
ncbi:hypothetical protein KOI35_42575 [Actinoplanes bogorensis]|uniref:Uncharacterized protein n=1 Tax=Paractinoplanes bogorensis TaxID=1610840 RepID=A0ABS5Z3E2_9ACTN|nr:hypothetical protein [Actinoplanes bogorensis]MBU2670207.1 hypothetical protein [Actinoplanes bogorensis]